MAREVLGIVGAAVGSIWGPAGAQYGFMIGSAIGSVVDPLVIAGPKLGDAPIQTSRDGVPIPIAWGTMPVKGNILQVTPHVDTTTTQRQGKGGGTKTTSTRRTQTFAIGLGRGPDGPIQAISRIWEFEKLVYDTRASPDIDAAETTKFAAGIRIYLGDEAQLPDPDLEADTGVGLTPAYRGLAYIVFVNYDITDFGSAIPQYRFEITTCAIGLLATSFSQDSGYAATQHTFYAGADFTHPFQGANYSNFFMGAVFKNKASDLDVTPRGIFNFYNGVIGTTFGKGARPSIQHFFTFTISGYNGGANRRIISDDFELTIDFPTWSTNDWYWMGVSYGQGPNAATIALVNLSQGEETFSATTVHNNDNVEWDPASDGNAKSLVTYGYQTPDGNGAPGDPSLAFNGAISQIMIHNSYLNLTVAANRRKFCQLGGVIDLGATGEIPFGEQPLIYMPFGHPSLNVGSLNIGTWPTDFFVTSPVSRFEENPPLGV